MSEYTMAVFGALEQGQADFQRTYSALQSEVSSLESQLRARDELEWVRRHLAEMPPDRATAMLLHAMGHELVEIAELTATSVAAAQSRLSRGRRELRAHLEEVHSGAPGQDDPRHP